MNIRFFSRTYLYYYFILFLIPYFLIAMSEFSVTSSVWYGESMSAHPLPLLWLCSFSLRPSYSSVWIVIRACCNLLELAANLSIFIFGRGAQEELHEYLCATFSVGVLIVVLTIVPLSALSGTWKAAGRIRSVCSGNQDIVLPRAQSLPPRKKNWWICFVTLNSVPCIIHLQFMALGSLFMFLRIFLWNV